MQRWSGSCGYNSSVPSSNSFQSIQMLDGFASLDEDDIDGEIHAVLNYQALLLCKNKPDPCTQSVDGMTRRKLPYHFCLATVLRALYGDFHPGSRPYLGQRDPKNPGRGW